MARPRIYIAGKFDAQARLRAERDRIHAAGLGLVVGSWLEEEKNPPGELTVAQEMEYATRDHWEVAESDLLILDTFDDNPRGGREVEYGMARALNIDTWIVGPRRNVFHQLSPKFDSWNEVVDQLTKEKREAYRL